MAERFHSSYVAGGMRAGALLPFGFGDAGDRARRVALAQARPCAPALIEELRAQDAALPPDDARRAAIEALARSGTVVVATGQQVGLLLGPLYTIYKAATAIAVARALERETGARAVPLFWLQTEDHDFHEIAGASVPRDGAPPVRLALDEARGEARCSIAQRVLGPEIAALDDALAGALAGAPRAAEVAALARAHYVAGASIAGAFAGLIAELFRGEGLIVFDPRRPRCARLAAPILRRAIVEHPHLESLLMARGAALRAAGFGEQIPIRAGSPLTFFHAGDARGPRHRLVRDGAGFRLAGRAETLDAAALLDALDGDPERGSSSALLRPIVQDALLPVAAYVGGPAEVDYLAQVAAIHPAFGLEPPLVAPRAQLRLTVPAVRESLRALGLAPADLDRPRDALARELGAAADAPGESWAAELIARLDGYAAGARDPQARRIAERARASALHHLGRLGRRHGRGALDGDSPLARHLERACDWLRPGGAPQERVHGFAAFAARSGVRELVRAVSAAIDPFDPSLKDVAL